MLKNQNACLLSNLNKNKTYIYIRLIYIYQTEKTRKFKYQLQLQGLTFYIILKALNNVSSTTNFTDFY